MRGPCLPRIEFHLEGGRTFTIVGRNTEAANVHVQSATLNGKPLTEPLIHHRDIIAGGTLEFDMEPRPSAWGCAGSFDAIIAGKETHTGN